MQKHTVRAGKKRLFIVLASGLILILLIATGYWFFILNKKQQASSDPTIVKQVEELTLIGDKDIAVNFVEAINVGKADEAEAIFRDRLKNTDDKNEKKLLLEQHISLALAYNLPDQALTSALAADDLESTHVTLSEVARVYSIKGDQENQLMYISKALDATEKIKNADVRESVRELYLLELDNFSAKEMP